MNTNGARASTAPGEQEPSPPEALHRLQQQIEELQAYFTHFVSAKVDGFLLSGRQIALWTALGIRRHRRIGRCRHLDLEKGRPSKSCVVAFLIVD